jgi:hypothetical protein
MKDPLLPHNVAEYGEVNDGRCLYSLHYPSHRILRTTVMTPLDHYEILPQHHGTIASNTAV